VSKSSLQPIEQDSSDTPTLAEYAAKHGLRHRVASLALPKATQLMRHGFLQEVRSLASGSLPGGLDEAWLAQVDYAYEGSGDIERSYFTLVLTEAAKSNEFAVRVLCHDRQLSKRDRSNPDTDRQVVELDDQGVRLESDRFLERYALSTDHDQDQLSVWQLFDPSLIQWLTAEAPAGFSFELQDGALSCFIPGITADEAQLDALCAAAARVFAPVANIAGRGGDAGTPRAGSRDDLVDRELARHPFATPPKSTKAAAKVFRRGLLLGDQAWALGAEAFFRAHAAEVGFQRIAPSTFRAGHLDTFFPGDLVHVAQGKVCGGAVEAFLIFTNDDSYDDMGWSVLVVDLRSAIEGLALVQGTPRGDATKRGSIQAGTDGRSLILSALDGGARDRSAAEFEAFFAAGSELVARLNAG
jgi:hypothetical protein